jgi:hypothetical protein
MKSTVAVGKSLIRVETDATKYSTLMETIEFAPFSMVKEIWLRLKKRRGEREIGPTM